MVRSSITGTMLNVHVDRNEPTPLHEQVAADMRRAIAEGEAGPANAFRWPRTWQQSWG